MYYTSQLLTRANSARVENDRNSWINEASKTTITFKNHLLVGSSMCR